MFSLDNSSATAQLRRMMPPVMPVAIFSSRLKPDSLKQKEEDYGDDADDYSDTDDNHDNHADDESDDEDDIIIMISVYRGLH